MGTERKANEEKKTMLLTECHSKESYGVFVLLLLLLLLVLFYFNFIFSCDLIIIMQEQGKFLCFFNTMKLELDKVLLVTLLAPSHSEPLKGSLETDYFSI